MYQTIQGKAVEGQIHKVYENTMTVTLPNGERCLCKKPKNMKRNDLTGKLQSFSKVVVEFSNGERQKYRGFVQMAEEFGIHQMTARYWANVEKATKGMKEKNIVRVKCISRL